PSERPRGAGPFARMVLKGYPFTLGLALTLIVMTIFAPVVKLRALARRWTIQHVAIIVKPEDYPGVVSDVQRALRAGGLETEPLPASWMLRMPTKFLALFARSAVAPLVADFLTNLVAPSIEVLVHPCDIVIMGRDLDAARARAAPPARPPPPHRQSRPSSLRRHPLETPVPRLKRPPCRLALEGAARVAEAALAGMLTSWQQPFVNPCEVW